MGSKSHYLHWHDMSCMQMHDNFGVPWCIAAFSVFTGNKFSVVPRSVAFFICLFVSEDYAVAC